MRAPHLAAAVTATAVIVVIIVTATATEDENENDNPGAIIATETTVVTHMLSSFRLHYILLRKAKCVTNNQQKLLSIFISLAYPSISFGVSRKNGKPFS